jgi:hypothetical protein
MIDPELIEDLRRALNVLRSMPEWQRDLVRNVDTDQVRAIVADHRHPIHPAQDPAAKVLPVGAGVVKTGDVGPQHRPVDPSATTDRSGWVEAKSIDSWRPPGVDLCDRIADHFAALDRAERVRELGEAAAVQRAEAELIKQQNEDNKPKGKGK